MVIFSPNQSVLKISSVHAQIDFKRLVLEREKMNTFFTENVPEYVTVEFNLDVTETKLDRFFDPAPFVPSDKKTREDRCEEILSIQAMGLKKRLEHTGCQSAVIGISGGLDSSLALLVTAKAFVYLGLSEARLRSEHAMLWNN